MLSSSINLSVSWILAEQHNLTKRNDFSFFTLNDKRNYVSTRATTNETQKVKGLKTEVQKLYNPLTRLRLLHFPTNPSSEFSG